MEKVRVRYTPSTQVTEQYFIGRRDVRDNYGRYLSEIGKTQLLKHWQELELGYLVQLGQDAIAYQISPSQVRPTIPSLAVTYNPTIAAQVWAIARLYYPIIKAGIYAKQVLIASNAKLVASIVKRYLRAHGRLKIGFLEESDLCQEGMLGLNRAAEKFDPTKGFHFSTYAYAWINQAIGRAVAMQATLVRLPVYIREHQARLLKGEEALLIQLGRKATHAELDQWMASNYPKLNWLADERRTTAYVYRCVQSSRTTSLDASPDVDNDDSLLGNVIEDKSQPDYQVVHDCRCILEHIGRILTPAEYTVFTSRNEITRKEVAAELGVSLDAVKRLANKADHKLSTIRPTLKRQLSQVL